MSGDLNGFPRDAPAVRFRALDEAISALEAGEIEWRQVFASPSLAGVWAALTAGLGVTARTIEGKPSHLHVLDPEESGLPALGNIELAIHASTIQMQAPALELKTLLLAATSFR